MQPDRSLGLSRKWIYVGAKAAVFLTTLPCMQFAGAADTATTTGEPATAEEVTLEKLLEVTSEDGKLLVSQGPRELLWYSDSVAYARIPGEKLGGSGESLLRIDAGNGGTERSGSYSYVGFSPDGKFALRFDEGRLALGRIVDGAFTESRQIKGWKKLEGRTGPSTKTFAWSSDSGSLAYVAAARAEESDREAKSHGASGDVLMLVDLKSLSEEVLFAPGRPIPAISWPGHRDSIFLAAGRSGKDAAGPESSLIEVSLDGRKKSGIDYPDLPAHMIRPIASPDGTRLIHSLGDYFHRPVAAALPVRSLDVESGALQSMVQAPGLDTYTLQWDAVGDLWAACRSGPLLDSFCRLGKDGSIGLKIAGPFNEEVKSFGISPDARKIAWTSLDVLGTFRIRMLDIGGNESREVYRSAPIVDQDRLARVKAFSWNTRDGMELQGLLITPKDFVAGRKYPLIVDVHGGPAPVALRGALFSSSPLEWQMWSDRGYLVFVSDYRESGAYGISEELIRSGPGKFVIDRNVDDVIDGIGKLKDDGFADPERIAIIGHSMGSVAANHMLMRGERFRAVVSKEGIPSWNLPGYYERMKDAWMWWFNASSEADLKRMLTRYSLESNTGKVNSPVLFINAISEHPDAATLVKKEALDRVVADLRGKGLEAEVVQLADEKHVPLNMENVREYGRITVDWIDRKLK
ncbi:alpha/beta hydrolase family protein [Pseudoxanthomonas yeongjuensis]|uniref:alpha/beta hydrolase family protein n=1 Tax=Pseudoxanthomonas yeongjuensis TaxID=377616 RepID=UPI001391CE54|nr:prolyl oligopeptidase family serine peptidase [Pseudoxanthomonas yeongjuensis]